MVSPHVLVYPPGGVSDNGLISMLLSGDPAAPCVVYAHPETADVVAHILDGEKARNYLHGLHAHHPETTFHSIRVMQLAADIALEIGLNDREAGAAGECGLYHDTGKLSIDPAILNKPDTLTDEEWRMMEQHPLYGFRVWEHLLDDRLLREIPLTALTHHLYQTRPYPTDPDAGKLIAGLPPSLFAPFIAAADQYTAMMGTRSYRQPLPPAEAKKAARANFCVVDGPDLEEELLDFIGNRFGVAA